MQVLGSPHIDTANGVSVCMLRLDPTFTSLVYMYSQSGLFTMDLTTHVFTNTLASVYVYHAGGLVGSEIYNCPMHCMLYCYGGMPLHVLLNQPFSLKVLPS